MDYVIRRISNRAYVVVSLSVLIEGSAAVWNAQVFLEIPELQAATVMFVGLCVHVYIHHTDAHT
jgi:hypothetical protein